MIVCSINFTNNIHVKYLFHNHHTFFLIFLTQKEKPFPLQKGQLSITTIQMFSSAFITHKTNRNL